MCASPHSQNPGDVAVARIICLGMSEELSKENPGTLGLEQLSCKGQMLKIYAGR